MSDMQYEPGQNFALDDLNLGDLSLDETVEGNIRMDLHPEVRESPLTDQRKMELFSRIPVTLTLEVASVEISLADLMSVSSNSVIELDKMAGEPLDIKVNGILFGKAEVVVLNDKYGLRIIEFNANDLGGLSR